MKNQPVLQRPSKFLTRSASLLLPVVFAGCAMPGKGGAIPTGHWAGDGFYVAEGWNKPGQPPPKNPDEPRSGHGCYPTTLSICPVQIDGHNLIDIRVYSRHANDPVFKKDTFEKDEGVRLKALLEEAKRIDDCTVLYRLVDFDVGPECREGTPGKYKPAPGIAATCTTHGGECTLILNYNNEFVDTFTFEGREVEKSGSFFSDEKGEAAIFHWVERLRKR
ncbi:MAG TPA: hypothetical protein VMV81_12050 [Phycisphaerae bacterium]|nr:hypothetical protein [Phycisphaerae bacterium]